MEILSKKTINFIGGSKMNESKKAQTGETIDPICGMTVKPETAAGSFAHKGTTYYFCSRGCLQKFINETNGEARFRRD